MVRLHTGIASDRIDVDAVLAEVRDPSCGAIDLFLGVVRDHHLGARVTGLTYEAWEREAGPALAEVARTVAADHPEVVALAAVHRVGALEIGEVAVAVAASAPHRAEAFAATRDLIDRLKAEVPIWKHEHLADGSSRWPGTDTPAGDRPDDRASDDGRGD